MKRLSSAILILTLTLCGCGEATRVAPKPLSIPRDPSLPTFQLYVEPVRFVADIPVQLSTELCSKNGDASQADYACLQITNPSDYRCVSRVVDGMGKDTAYSEILVTGERNFPNFGSTTLTSQFVTALSGIGNLDARGNRNAAPTQSMYRVRAFLTEFYPEVESDAQGFGGLAGPFAITQLARAESNSKMGYVRFDISISEVATNRVVDTFIAAGAFSESSTSYDLVRIQQDKTMARVIVQEASKAALQDAAIHIFDTLKAYPKKRG